MSARLTLLILCDQAELHSQLFTAFLSADFEIITAHRTAQAAQILLTRAFDSIMIRANAVADCSLAGSKLKKLAPLTPVLLLADECRERFAATPSGIDSICYADFRQDDESVMRAIAFVFRHTLAAARVPRAGRSTETLGYRADKVRIQIAV